MNAFAQVPGTVDNLAQLGLAGLVCAMWLWERSTNRKREEQLDEAHSRIMADDIKLEELIAVVKQNAEALTRLTATHEQLLRAMTTGKTQNS